MQTGAARTWSVGEVARIAHVTVRALHHYDEIGLLRPGARTASGHRRYDAADLDRLQQLLFYRELGFPLDAGRRPPGPPRARPARAPDAASMGCSRSAAARLRAMAESVARTIQARRAGISLTPEEMFDVFGDFDPTQYADEAQRALGRHRRLPPVAAADGVVHQGRLGAGAGRAGRGDPAARRGDGGRAAGGQRRGDGRRRGAPAAHLAALLRLRVRHPPRARRRCTSPTSGSPPTTRTSRPGWPGTCTTRSSPTPPAPAPDPETCGGIPQQNSGVLHP